ncbi:MAG: hypothetical protein R3F55_11490 [Alphaproteobacteria bacterium]
MRSLTRLVSVASLLAAVGLSVPAMAEEPAQFNPEDGVSSATIRAQGFQLQLTDGTVVKLIGASMPRRPNQDCLVHIPSVRLAVERGIRAGTLGPIGTAAQQINLQALQDPNTGEVWCRGAGTGCAIIIQ